MCSTCYLQTVDNAEKDSWFSGRLIIEGLCVLQFCPTLFSMTSSSYVLSDQVVLFQINKSCCGDRDLGGWFNAAYTTSKSVLQTNLQVITFLLRNNLKRVGDRCKAEHENQWCNFQGITRAGLGARDREEYGVIVISYRVNFEILWKPCAWGYFQDDSDDLRKASCERMAHWLVLQESRTWH